MPPLLIFYSFLDAQCKTLKYDQQSNTIFIGQLRASVLEDPMTAEIYTDKTGKVKEQKMSIDPDYVQFVRENWDDISSKWYSEKLRETRYSLTSSIDGEF